MWSRARYARAENGSLKLIKDDTRIAVWLNMTVIRLAQVCWTIRRKATNGDRDLGSRLRLDVSNHPWDITSNCGSLAFQYLKVVALICSPNIWHWINIMICRSSYHLETFLQKIRNGSCNSKLHYYEQMLYFAYNTLHAY